MKQLVCNTMNVDSSIEDLILDLNIRLESQNSIYKLDLKPNNSVDIVIEDDGADTTVSSLVLIPVKESQLVMLDETGECSITLKAYSNMVFLEPWTISPDEVLNKKKILCHWGIKDLDFLTSKQFDVSLKVFFELAKSIPKVKIYGYDGWDKLGRAFILGNLKISASNVEKVEIEQNEKDIVFDETLSSSETCRFINEVYFGVTRNRTYSQIMFLYYFLGLNMKRFLKHDMVPSFLLGIIGPSGSMKTSSSMPMLNPTGMKTTSFDDKPAAIICIVKENLYGCTLIDDMNNKSRDKVEKLEKIVRMGGDRTTASKKMVGGRVENIDISSLSVFTAEGPPPVQPSSFPRMLMLPFDFDTVDGTMLDCLTEGKSQHIAAIIHLIQNVMRDKDFSRRFIEAVLVERNLHRNLRQENGLHGRYIEMYSWLATGWKYIKEYFKSNDVILSEAFEEELMKLIVAQHRCNKLDPVAMFSKALLNLMASNSFHVLDYPQFKAKGSCDIINEGNMWFIKSGSVFGKITDYYNRLGTDFPCSEKELRTLLKEQHLLFKKPNAKGTLTSEKKSAEGHSMSGFYIYINLLKEKFEEENTL